MKNGCGSVLDSGITYTYVINGLNTEKIGEGDHHETAYDEYEIVIPLLKMDIDEATLSENVGCLPELTFTLYPSKQFEESFYTNEAAFFTTGVVAIFAFTTLVFMLYDFSVRKRQTKVMERIIRQDKLVSNVFPAAIRDRLYGNEDNQKKTNEDSSPNIDGIDDEIFGAAPLADLFPSASIIYMDISGKVHAEIVHLLSQPSSRDTSSICSIGFTAWSSAREPPQVFMLLESMYSAFDKLAYRHGVFKVRRGDIRRNHPIPCFYFSQLLLIHFLHKIKVETVGDVYIGVAGLPEEREDHAIVVARFARDCVHKTFELTRKLEVTLG